MKVGLDYRAKAREVLELLDVIKVTNYDTMLKTWRERQWCAIDYHLGCSGRGGEYIYYDTWCTEKIDETSAHACAEAMRVIPDDFECRWLHTEEEVSGRCVTAPTIITPFMVGRKGSSACGVREPIKKA